MFPDNDAVVSVHQGVRLSYREFHEQVEQAARGLLALGIQVRRQRHALIASQTLPDGVTAAVRAVRLLTLGTSMRVCLNHDTLCLLAPAA